MFEWLKKRQIISALLVLFIISLAGASYYAGYQNGVKNPKVEIIKGVVDLNGGQEEGVDFSLFWDAWKILKEKYIDSDQISNQELVYGAISGLFGAAKDPYSIFMAPSQAQSFNQEISGEFGGIGAELGLRQGQLTIVAPLKNTPAEKIGLKAGDKILSIDNNPTVGMSVDEAVKKIRGDRGTKVTLMIFRDGWDKPRDFTIIRDVIQIPTLDWKMVDQNGKDDPNGRILYVQLYNFYEKAPLLFYQMALETILKTPPAAGIVLDLRNNPGGYLDASVDIAGWFLDTNSLVVSEKFKSGEIQSSKTKFNGLFRNIPAVVIINQGSASASEILAGALRDDREIKLIGQKSFGKGSVQEVDQLKDGSLIKITIAHWLTPKGLVIEKNGLKPDFEVEITDQDAASGKDPQFDKAIEVLKSQLSQ